VTRRLSVLAVALGLSGCVAYAPAPPRPEAFQPTFEARRLDEKPAGATWSGAELLAAALSRNPQIVEARAKYETAAAAARTARVGPPLGLTLTAEYANQAPRWGHSGSVDIPLDVGARRSSRLGAADLQALQAWYDVAEAVWSVRTALAKAVVARRAAEVEVGLATEAATLRQVRLERLDRRVAAGEDDRSLALLAQGDLAAAERRLSDARGRYAQAVADLGKALGIASPSLGAVVLAPPPASPSLAGLEDWRRDALLQRNDVLRALVDYDLAETALRLEVAKQYPEIRLSPGYNYDHGVTKLPFSLSLVLPPADLNRHAIDQAEAARAAAGKSVETLQANALASVDAAIAALTTAEKAVQVGLVRELPAARRSVEAARRGVAAGSADRVDELGARAAALDADLTLLDNQRSAQTAAIDLEDALRRPFDPAEAAVLAAALIRPGDRP